MLDMAFSCKCSESPAALSRDAQAHATDHPDADPTRLTFFQKYFTRPQTKDDNNIVSNPRQFSYRSRGFLLASLTMLISIFGIVAAVVGVTVDAHHHDALHRISKSNPNDVSQSPIRSAIISNFPDPALCFVNGTWYAFATNNAAG